MPNPQRLVLFAIIAMSLMVAIPFTMAASTTQSSTSTVSTTASSTLSTTATSTTTIPPLQLINIYASNSVAAQGQGETLTATISGGIPPYFYNFLARNTLTGNILFQSVSSNSVTSNTARFLLPLQPNDIGLIAINVNVTDSTNSVAIGSNSITVTAQQANTTTSSSTSSSSTTASTSSTTPSTSTLSTMLTTSVQSSIDSTLVSNLVESYASALVNGTSGSQLNSTQALNLGQLNLITAKLLGMGAAVNHVYVNMSYGSISQGGKIVGAGKTLYYVQYSGNNSVIEYAVSISKKTPDLHVKVFNFTTDSSMGNMTLLQSVYTTRFVDGAPHLYPQRTYSINPQLFSSTQGNNQLNYTYSIYVGGSLKATGSSQGSAINRGFSYSNIPIDQPTKIVFDAQGNANYTSIDPTIYVFYSSGNAATTISTNTQLSSDLVCGSLTINSGITLTTNGFNILCNSTITNSGTIAAGNPGNGGTGASGGGGSYTSSYAGSGGGGGSAKGGNTGGSTPAAPTVTATLIQNTWYPGPFSNYNSGGGGGGSGAGNSGGSGSYGIYIQANSISAGVITANGIAGTTSATTGDSGGGTGGSTLATGGTGTTSGGHPGTDGGGGGGGGWVLLSYGTASAPSLTNVFVSNGLAGGGTSPGSAGAAGNSQTFSYGTSAPIVVLEQLRSISFTATSDPVTQGNNQVLTATVANGLFPYTYNYMVYNSVGLVTNALYTGVSLTSNTFTYPQSSSWGTGTFTANLVVTANYIGTTNTITNTLTYTANPPPLSSVTITSTPTLPASLSPGSLITFSSSWSGGSSPYSANYLITNTVTGTVLTYQLNTGITGSTSNSFAWTIPSTYGGNTLKANVIVTDATPTTANSVYTGTLTVTAGSCVPTISNTLINFGTVLPGSFAPTANAVLVTDSGSASSNIVLYSTSTTTGNWISGSLSFLVSNTVWDGASHASAIVGNQLTNTITTDTQIALTGSGSHNLFFGVNVPKGQPSGTYTQGVTVSLSC